MSALWHHVVEGKKGGVNPDFSGSSGGVISEEMFKHIIYILWPVRSLRWWRRGWHRHTSWHPARRPRPERERKKRCKRSSTRHITASSLFFFKGIRLTGTVFPHSALIRKLLLSRGHARVLKQFHIITGWMSFSNHGSFKPTQCKLSKQQLRERGLIFFSEFTADYLSMITFNHFICLCVHLYVSDWRRESKWDHFNVSAVYLTPCGTFWHFYVHFCCISVHVWYIFVSISSPVQPTLLWSAALLAVRVAVWHYDGSLKRQVSLSFSPVSSYRNYRISWSLSVLFSILVSY